MYAIKQARKFIEAHPHDPQAKMLVELVEALQEDRFLPMSRLYEADLHVFDLMLDIVREWRLDHHYAKKERLLEPVSLVRNTA